jgi:hypothetical protein
MTLRYFVRFGINMTMAPLFQNRTSPGSEVLGMD